jgi:origin recognition complex subunit 6
VPRWIGPTIRLLCRELETPRAVPHVLAGVETVLCLPSPEDNVEEERMEGKVPALISAVWFFVVVKMRGKGNYGKETFARKKLVLDVLARAREDKSIVDRVGEEEESWRGYEAVVHEKDVNAWRKEILARKCKEMDWFENIDEGCGVDGVPAPDESDVEEDVVDIVVGKEIKRAGGGTMIQEKFNYLSEGKRREFEEWKMGMMARIDELIAEGIMDTTDG